MSLKYPESSPTPVPRDLLQERLHKSLERFLPRDDQPPEHLHAAMRYSMLMSGKRLRPLLTYEVGQALAIPLDILDYPACAIEMVHGFSLIHDDLPAIDDDDLRRGRPSCHRQFDEATAILAGDALYGLAFQTLAQTPQVCAQMRLDMISLLARCSGSQGMIGGEMMDISAEHQEPDQDQLLRISEWKTARLIQCALLLPTYLTQTDSVELRLKLEHYGFCVGLAFQLQDDILDAQGQNEYLGKTPQGDRRQAKATLPLLKGCDEAQKRRDQYLAQAKATLGTMTINLENLHEYLALLILKS